jgi:flagellar biosynthesis GTPase FlhF
MKIKRYMAESMRAALAQVRAEQGPDAVILSSRRVEEGIEVIAAVDYDEALFAGATQKRTAVGAAGTVQPPALVRSPEPPPASSPMSLFDQMLGSEEVFRLVMPPDDDEKAPAAAATVLESKGAPDGSYHEMQREMKELREMLRGAHAEGPRFEGFVQPHRRASGDLSAGGRQVESGQRRRHRAGRVHGRRQDDDHRQIGDALEHAAWKTGYSAGEHRWETSRSTR